MLLDPSHSPKPPPWEAEGDTGDPWPEDQLPTKASSLISLMEAKKREKRGNTGASQGGGSPIGERARKNTQLAQRPTSTL